MQIEANVSESVELDQVRQAQAGDSDAFGWLVQRYQRRAVSVAYRLLGNTEDAADVSQDAFVRAHRSLSQLEDPSRFGAWLMRTVCNLALNLRRTRAGRAAAPWNEALDASDDLRRPSGGRHDSGDHADAQGSLPRELNAAIVEALNDLPEKQRLALVLFSVEGLPQKEVAEILDCSVELVKWNVFQARKKLKDKLEAHL